MYVWWLRALPTLRTMAAASALPSKLKKKAMRVKHQKVKVFRANEPFLSVFMWGVNHTVSYISLSCILLFSLSFIVC